MDLTKYVLDTLKQLSEFSNTIFWTTENHTKYSTLNDQELEGKYEIFRLMRSLNEKGVLHEGVCASNSGDNSLKHLLEEVADKAAELTRGKRIHYVELGPEPVKTSFIMYRVVRESEGFHYTGIDINKTSEAEMRDALVPHLRHAEHFHFIADNYHKVKQKNIDYGQDITFITLLGFQEGNEHPEMTARLIRQLGGNSALVLSEIQLYAPGLEKIIYDFYLQEEMCQFSRLVCLQQGYRPYGKHAIRLIPVCIDGNLYRAAVTLQPAQAGELKGFMITNICLKYTAAQFRDIRTRYGNCRIRGEFISGDNSVMYLLAEYAANTQF